MNVEPEAVVEFELDAEALDVYDRKGFWLGPTVFDESEVRELREAVIGTLNGQKDFDCMHWGLPPGRLDRGKIEYSKVGNAWWVNAVIRDTIKHPVIASIASKLMRTDGVRLIHDQTIYKPGLGSAGETIVDSNIGWHQDAPHWTVFDTTVFTTAWISLQDTDEDNGGMRFVVGSHRWGMIEDAHTYGNKDLESLKQHFATGRDWVEEPCVLKSGQVSFHSGLTFHGSGPNVTNEPRLCIALNFMPDGTRYNKHGMYHQLGKIMGPYVRHGDLVGDPHFPLVWPNN